MRFQALSTSRGFTLIEVMIAIVVLAFGLLALAGLQLQMLRFSQSSTLRTIASSQAAWMGDLALSHRPELAADEFNISKAVAVSACTTTAGCTTAEAVHNAMFMWNQSLHDLLGANASGIVCLDAIPDDGTSSANAVCDGNGTQQVIKIWWTDDRSGTSGRFVTNLLP